jgi:ribosomal protein L37AE/L43A
MTATPLRDDDVVVVPDDRVKIVCPECHGNGFHRHIGDDGFTIHQCRRCNSEGEI